MSACLKNLFPSWEFSCLDANGCSGGLETGLNPQFVNLINSWGMGFSLGNSFHSTEFDKDIMFLNVYIPQHNKIHY